MDRIRVSPLVGGSTGKVPNKFEGSDSPCGRILRLCATNMASGLLIRGPERAMFGTTGCGLVNATRVVGTRDKIGPVGVIRKIFEASTGRPGFIVILGGLRERFFPVIGSVEGT